MGTWGAAAESIPAQLTRYGALKRSPAVGFHGPKLRLFIPAGVIDAGAELDVAAQIEAVGNMIQVTLGFRLRGEALRPVPLRQQLVGKPVLVGIGLGIHRAPG
ncbi:MAG: hypothetical protein R3E50_15740 [Halioglobus sp.]